MLILDEARPKEKKNKKNCIFHRSLKTLEISKTDFYVFYFPSPGYVDGPSRFTEDSELCPEQP
jgi:hypothetical protein